MKPRLSGFSCFSSSVHGIAVNEPVLPDSPSSDGLEPLVQVHWPGSVATMRTRKVRSPSQNPYTRFLKFGPAKSTHTVTSVYGFGNALAAVSVISCFSHTWTGAVAGAANSAAGIIAKRTEKANRTRYRIVIISSCRVLILRQPSIADT